MDPATLAGIGMKIGGALLDRQAVKDANHERRVLADAEAARQREFAQMGIQWKVKDALAAGVHPLFALGASTTSYAPQSIGVEKSGIGSALADMGQDVSRAATAASSAPVSAEIVKRTALQNEGLALDNDIKRATLADQMKKLSAPNVGGVPLPEGKIDPRAVGFVGGHKMGTDPGTSDVEAFWQKRYGEPGEWIGAGVVGWNDLMHNMKENVLRDAVRWMRNNNMTKGFMHRYNR